MCTAVLGAWCRRFLNRAFVYILMPPYLFLCEVTEIFLLCRHRPKKEPWIRFYAALPLVVVFESRPANYR